MKVCVFVYVSRFIWFVLFWFLKAGSHSRLKLTTHHKLALNSGQSTFSLLSSRISHMNHLAYYF